MLLHLGARCCRFESCHFDQKISLWSSTPHRDFSIECYKVAKKTPDGIDYEITIDGKNGYATVAMTKYYDGTEEPTLPINLGTHSIYFYAE